MGGQLAFVAKCKAKSALWTYYTRLYLHMNKHVETVKLLHFNNNV